MFLDNNTATASHKARAHGPGWRTAHAGSHCSGDNSFQQKCDLGDTGTMGKKIGHNRVS